MSESGLSKIESVVGPTAEVAGFEVMGSVVEDEMGTVGVIGIEVMGLFIWSE